MNKHLSEEDLVLIYYNEPGIPADIRRHAVECSECQAAAETLRQTLDLCNEWNVPEPDAQFERSVWTGLAPALVEARRSRSPWLAPKIWVAAAAAVVLMAGAFALGTLSNGNDSAHQPVIAGLSAQARERILAISLADHLDRTGMLLTEISNSSDSKDFALERGRAQDLIEEDRLMRQTLALTGKSATVGFLDDVERFLLEIANAPDMVSAAEVQQMRERIGSDSLLFKVKIIEANLRTQGQKL
jgi:hypothetical protein